METLRGLVIEVALEAVDSKSLEKVSPEQLEKSLARLEEKVAGMPQGPRWQESLEKAVEEAATTEAPPTDRKGLLKLAKRLPAALPQARSDLDAHRGKVNNWEFCFGYLAGYVIDGLFGIITAVVLATANAWQAAFLSPALHQHQAHVPGKAGSMTVDSAFDFPEVYQVLDEAEMKGYIASRDHRGPKGCFGPECFTWKEGHLFCPNEQPMMAMQTHNDDKVTYQGQECATCGLREQCVGQEAQKPRIITLHPVHHRRWQENRVANRSEEHKQAQKRHLAIDHHGQASDSGLVGRVGISTVEKALFIAGFSVSLQQPPPWCEKCLVSTYSFQEVHKPSVQVAGDRLVVLEDILALFGVGSYVIQFHRLANGGVDQRPLTICDGARQRFSNNPLPIINHPYKLSWVV